MDSRCTIFGRSYAFGCEARAIGRSSLWLRFDERYTVVRYRRRKIHLLSWNIEGLDLSSQIQDEAVDVA
jgi:hypothetical protein